VGSSKEAIQEVLDGPPVGITYARL